MQVNVINVASSGQYGLGLLAAAIHVGGGTCLQILITPAQWQICLKIPQTVQKLCHCQQRIIGGRGRCHCSSVWIVWMDSGCVEIVRLLVTNTDKTGEQTHYGH